MAKKCSFFYALIAFLALFTYLYPIAFVFLPLDTGRILHVFGVAYVLFVKKACIPKRIYTIFKYASFLVIMGLLATIFFNNSYDFSFLLKLIAVFLYSFSAIMVVDLIKISVKNFSVYTVLEWMVYAAVIQAIISFLLFFSPPIKDVVLSMMKQSEVAESIVLSQSAFRLIALSKTQYASMAVMYGFALFFAITLSFSGQSDFYKKKFRFYFSVFIVCIAGILSARSFFLIAGLAFVYLCYLLYLKYGYRTIIYICGVSGIAFAIFLGSFYFLKDSEYSETYEWAFEWYINLLETGSFETNSTNKLQTMWHFPSSTKTWLLGDGMFHLPNGAFYMSTDVGYLRNLFYWGLLGTTMMYFVQYLYFRTVSSSTDCRLIKILCLVMFFWVLIYNVKEFWFADLYWILLLASLVLMKKTNNVL